MYRGVYEKLGKLKQRFLVSENFVNEVIMVSKSTHHVLILPGLFKDNQTDFHDPEGTTYLCS